MGLNLERGRRINEIRKQIKALRVSMLEAEAVMHDQINRDEDCSWVAGEILAMRNVWSRSEPSLAIVSRSWSTSLSSRGALLP